MSDTRTCRYCGDHLTDTRWMFDPCPVSPDGAHYQPGDDIVCLCGNRTDLSGFGPCLPDGTQVEPDADGPWDGRLYVCLDCGLIADGITLEVKGYSRGHDNQEGSPAGHPPGKPAQAP